MSSALLFKEEAFFSIYRFLEEMNVIDNIHKACHKFVTSFLFGLKWGYEKRYQYHLDGVEVEDQSTYISFHVRGRRTGCRMHSWLVSEERFISEFHPVDACFIGALSISTNDLVTTFLKHLHFAFKQQEKTLTTVKASTLLVAQKIFSRAMNSEKIIISPTVSSRPSAEICLYELVANPDLLTGPGSKSAFKIGQEISRKLISNEKNTRH